MPVGSPKAPGFPTFAGTRRRVSPPRRRVPASWWQRWGSSAAPNLALLDLAPSDLSPLDLAPLDLAYRQLLLRLEVVLHPALGPVAREGHLGPLQPALHVEHVSEALHVAPLAVGKDLHPALGPLGIAHRRDQQFALTGGGAATQQPAQFDAGRPGDGLDVGVAVHFEQGEAAGILRQGFDRR